MKKRIISFITAFSMAAMAHIPLPALAADTAEPAAPEVALAETYGELEYAVNDDGTVTITGCDQSVTSVDIPAEIEGKPVTAIGDWAFQWCYSLTSITIPDSVTNIGELAFKGRGSLNIIVADGNAVYSSKDGVLFNKDGTEIIAYAKDVIQPEYDIPEGVISIGDYAFYNCDSLSSISIPGSVTTIGYYAFYDCNSLTDVYYSGTEEQWNAIDIGEYNDALLNAAIHYTSVTEPTPEPTNTPEPVDPLEGLEYAVNDDGTVTITGCDQSVTSIDIPAEIDGMAVTAIDNGAFWRCDSLTSVRIPDSVTTIGDHAFYSCGSLTGISIPGSVTTIGDYAFERCESLTNISIPNSVTTIGDSTFCDCYNLTGISIPDSVTTIGNSAFNGCSNLTGISIPDSVTSIGDNAFADCESLTGISIPDSVTTIGYGAFYGCSNLTGINIPDSVTSIGGSAFAYCTSLTNITISDNVTNIGYRAFYGTELYNDESNWTDDVLYIDNYLIEARTNIEHCDIKQGCLLIAERAFYRCSNLTGITIPDSVTSIGDNTFTDCGHLNIIVDDKNTVYSSKDGVLFNKDMTELIVYAKDSIQQEYDIPESVTSIGDYAFEQCYGLTNITIPEGVTSIGDYAFSDCCRLNIIVADGNAVYSSKDGVLFNKDGTELIVYTKDVIQPKYYIPKGVTSICDGAFNGCDNLTGISIPDSVTIIGDNAFNGCLNLTSISIPDGVTAIGDSVFYYCNRLTSISIPDSVTTIGNAAFYHCDSLTDVYYSGTKEQWYAIDIDWENDVLADATIHYNSTPVVADCETAILHYAAGENGSSVVNSIAVNNRTEAIQCIVYTAVYDSAGALKGAGMADVDIAAESDTGVDITVPCSIETGDTIKNFMWNDMTPLCTADEVAAA